MIAKYLDKQRPWLLIVFRLLVGIMFFMHGAQKLLGWFGGSPKDLMSLMGLAGVLEVVIGMLVVIGLFTRYAAIVGAVEMIYAYFSAHFPASWVPLINKGEPALLYFAAFLILAGYGAGKASLDAVLFKA